MQTSFQLSHDPFLTSARAAFVGCGWTDCAKGTPMVSGVSRRRSRANSSPTHEVAWKSAGDGGRLRMPRENHGAYI